MAMLDANNDSYHACCLCRCLIGLVVHAIKVKILDGVS